MAEHLEPVILTVARQMASGGSYIGDAVARKLQIAYMNREIVQRAAAMLRVDDPHLLESFEETRQTIWTRLLHGFSRGTPEAPVVRAPVNFDQDDVFDVETRIIRAIAEREDAVIVGHGAGYLLRNHPGVIRVFVHAPEAWRILAAQQTYALEPETAKTLIRESDRRRARFIEGLTGVVWTDARLYDLTVDTSKLEIGMIVEWLAGVVRARFDRRHATLRTES